MKNPWNSCVILVPSYNHIEPETDRSLRSLEALGFVVERRFGQSNIDIARSQMASSAITAGYEWLYWIDGDILFEVADFLALVERDEKFCCAPYAMKGSGGRVACLELTTPSYKNTKQRAIRAAGFGFMKTHRSIYEAMIEQLPTCQQVPNGQPLWPFFHSTWWKLDNRTVFFGEDYSFCLSAEQLGFKLLADFSIKIGHIGKWAFTINNPL